MKKKLYYSVELEIDSSGTEPFLAGMKTVNVYDIVNNKPEPFCDFDLSLEVNTKEEIQEYLIDNGYGDDDFEFILL